MSSDDSLVEQFTKKHAAEAANNPRLFPQFAQKVAGTADLLESNGVNYLVIASHAFGHGWSLGLMPKIADDTQRFVATVRDDANNSLEVFERGMQVRNIKTPTDLLNYARRKLGSPSP